MAKGRFCGSLFSWLCYSLVLVCQAFSVRGEAAFSLFVKLVAAGESCLEVTQSRFGVGVESATAAARW